MQPRALPDNTSTNTSPDANTHACSDAGKRELRSFGMEFVERLLDVLRWGGHDGLALSAGASGVRREAMRRAQNHAQLQHAAVSRGLQVQLARLERMFHVVWHRSEDEESEGVQRQPLRRQAVPKGAAQNLQHGSVPNASAHWGANYGAIGVTDSHANFGAHTLSDTGALAPCHRLQNVTMGPVV